jgi:integrase/recombinase XerC
MQIPISQLIRIDSPLEVVPVIPDSRVEIWDSFLSLQIKETTRRSYTKALADFCLKVYPDLLITDALQSFLSLSQSDALHQVLTYRKILIDLKLSSATINQRLSALKSLVDYARKRSLCSFTLIDVKGLRLGVELLMNIAVCWRRSTSLHFWVSVIMRSVDCCGTML